MAFYIVIRIPAFRLLKNVVIFGGKTTEFAHCGQITLYFFSVTASFIIFNPFHVDFVLGPVCTLSTNSAVFFYALLTIEPLESAVEVFEATAVPRALQYSVLLGTEHVRPVVLQTSHGQEF